MYSTRQETTMGLTGVAMKWLQTKYMPAQLKQAFLADTNDPGNEQSSGCNGLDKM